jgi:hypothetical protein
MAVAGLKSTWYRSLPSHHNDHPSPNHSCYLALVCPGCRLPAHHPLVCSMGKLATSHSWCVTSRKPYLSNSRCYLALTFVLAPLPNALFSHCGGDDFSAAVDEGSGPVDVGRFITSIVVVTGFALPLVLAHSEVIRPGACVMSIIGGGCVSLFYPCGLMLTQSSQFGLWNYIGLFCCIQTGRVRFRLIASFSDFVETWCNISEYVSSITNLFVSYYCYQSAYTSYPFVL